MQGSRVRDWGLEKTYTCAYLPCPPGEQAGLRIKTIAVRTQHANRK
ncbi:hypothetical protein Desac_1625 [Desulfobacca acetoxidans DSM 11109]|uniref:Uncharacterized protein n=1 Tax=Desulfobacca acetoxidans (strain ATCC 700848 / DSM 11109 / ASRB2) TaxID=880072 RepID=F2NJG2_DESAR|nr:hypothetical protein Desac_1625 [Desulfobacca acetoxidans DSM 11109]